MEKISAVKAKIREFEQLADKTADDNTAINHLNTVTTILNDVSELLTGRKRRKRSAEGKISIYWQETIN